jgi:YHS domain-containing protein/thioredoxin-related protein
MIQRKFRSIQFGVKACLALGWLFLAVSAVVAAGPDDIPWRQDLRRAQAEAQAQNRPIWVQFTGPWCHFCDRMERESFVHPKIVGHARDFFVPVKLRSDVHEDLALHFGLTGLPATIILKPSGEELARHEGYVNADTFHAFLQDTLSRHGLLAQAKANPVEGRAEPGVALAGYCPVSLVQDHRLIPGQDTVTLTHEGRVYRFANPLVRSMFRQKPEQFIPVNRGRCPVAQVDGGEARPGDPRWSVLYQGHLYLCSTEEGRQRFLNQPERYAHVDVADRGFCPHCWAREGLLIRGQNRFSLTRAGRRYLFPDPGHLEAFREDPEITRR